MSSVALHSSRKRLRSPDYRDNSWPNDSHSESESDPEFDGPPLKLRKYYGNNYSLAFIRKFREIAAWLAELPVKEFFAMAMQTGSRLHEDIIIDDDDDDEIQEVKEEDPDKLLPLIKKFEQCHKFPSSGSRTRHLETNGSFPINPCFGRHNTYWDSEHKNGDYTSQSSSLRRAAVVSNPPTDIEILLATKPKVPSPEVDEIEILSESPSTKQKHVSSQKSHHLLTSSSRSSSSLGRTHNLQPARRLQSSSSSKGFTANEVVRLQEKAQYKLLLEKFTSGPRYHPIFKNAKVVDNPLPPEVKFTAEHFKKEILCQPVKEFVHKFYKQLQSVSSEKSKQASEKEPLEIKIDDSDDEELKIVSVTLPQIKPKYHSDDYFSKDWLTQLKNTIQAQTEERMKIVDEQERALECYRKERLLKLVVADRPSKPAESEFPKLTPEMEEIIDKALSPGCPEERLCRIKDFVCRKDIETLAGLNWLNDLVINAYFDLIVERSKQDGYPSVYAFNTFFYHNLKNKGYSNIKRWTRRVDIFSYDLNFVPMHLGVHWCLAVIDHRSKQICYYDSMGEGEDLCLDILHDYLMLEHKDKKGQNLPHIYSKEKMKDIPQQMNGSDCGMFTVKYAEYKSRDAEITFCQENMIYFRRRMIYELLTAQLL